MQKEYFSMAHFAIQQRIENMLSAHQMTPPLPFLSE